MQLLEFKRIHYFITEQLNIYLSSRPFRSNVLNVKFKFLTAYNVIFT